MKYLKELTIVTNSHANNLEGKFMITIKIIDKEHKADINIKNEPFKLFGRMIPSYKDEQWTYNVERLPEEKITEMCFPDELAKKQRLRRCIRWGELI